MRDNFYFMAFFSHILNLDINALGWYEYCCSPAFQSWTKLEFILLPFWILTWKIVKLLKIIFFFTNTHLWNLNKKESKKNELEVFHQILLMIIIFFNISFDSHIFLRPQDQFSLNCFESLKNSLKWIFWHSLWLRLFYFAINVSLLLMINILKMEMIEAEYLNMQ